MNELITYSDLFDFSGPNPIAKAAKSIETLEAAYTKLAANLTAEAIRIGQAQNQVAASLDKLEKSIRAVNLATEQGRRNGAKVAAEVNEQSKAYNNLRLAQKGAEAMNKGVADSLAGLRQQLKADRAELIALGQAANPKRIQELAQSIQETKVKSEQLERAVRGTNTVLTAAKGSYNALVAENRKLSVELKNLADTQTHGAQRTQESIAREQALKIQLANNTAQLKTYDASLNQHFRNVGNYAASIIEAVNALQKEKAALTAEEAALIRASKAANLDAAAHDRLQKELAETQAKLGGVNNQLETYGHGADKGATIGQQLSGSLSQAGNSLKSFALQTLVATVGITALIQGGQKLLETNAEYSDQLADVAKTTGLTIDETENLANSLKRLDTRTGLGNLLKIAEIGGQLGIAKQDIEGFTKAIDTASIALQSDFGGDVERIATELGKINTIFRLSDAVGIETALLDIGSAVNELGASGAATAPFLTDYAQRVGAVAANAGLGLDKVLGFGAALEELGFSAEVAGTATNKLLAGLSGNSGKFFAIAKLADANLTLKKFKSLVNNDVNGALNLFLKGLKNGGAATTDFAQLVQSLGLKSGGAASVLTALARNTELVSQKQAIANTQLDNGNSLAKEAAIKNDNLAASYEKLKNKITSLVTDGKIGGFFKRLIDGALALATNNIKVVQQVDLLNYSAAAGTKQLAKEAGELLVAYQNLNREQNKTPAQLTEMRRLTIQLQQALGESVAPLNAQTGLYELNTAAVSVNIAKKREEVDALALAIDDKRRLMEKEATTEAARAKALAEKASVAGGGFVEKGLGQKSADAAAAKAKAAAEKEKQLQIDLNALGYDAARLDALRAARIPKLTEAQLLDAESKKKEAKAAKELAKGIEELAKAEYELAKFRLENRAETFSRQANNGANPEEFRVAAAEKAAAQRVAIAELEQKEKIRIAVKEAKTLQNGDAVLAIQRQLISEQYAARIKEIDRDLSKEEKDIHNDLLAQLREVDRLRIDVEQNALERVLADENAGFAVRSAAQSQYAANMILLAKTVYDEEIIAANGAANKVKLAVDKMAKAVEEARRSVKPFDSALANDALGVDYSKDQLALENSRAAGKITEEEYAGLRRDMENEYLQNHLTNLQVEKDGTKEAIEEELALRRKQKDEEIALEKEKLAKRLAIIEAGVELAGNLGNGLFEIGNAQREQELAAIQTQKDNDLAIAGDNAKAKSRIENDAARESAKIKRKQALADRAQALFNIALNTGVAVTKAVMESPLTFGLPWSGFALANGVIQAGLVLAKPIPAFAKGTNSAPGGVALVGEAGPELLQYGGKERLVSQPTLVDMQAGTKVINNRETVKIFEERGLSMNLAAGYSKSEQLIASAQQSLSAGDVARIVGRQVATKFEELKETIANQKSVAFSFDKRGFNASIIQGQRNNQIMDSRYNRK